MGFKNDGPTWDDVWETWAYMCTTRNIELRVCIWPARRTAAGVIQPASAFVTARWWNEKKLQEKTECRRFRGNGGASTMPGAIYMALLALQAQLDLLGRIERYSPGVLPPPDEMW